MGPCPRRQCNRAAAARRLRRGRRVEPARPSRPPTTSRNFSGGSAIACARCAAAAACRASCLPGIPRVRSAIGLSQLFELFGQEVFRRNERTALEAILERHPRFVLATGGSLVTEPGTFELLSSSCRTVWLKADPEEHMRRVVEQGDLRPMANNDRAMDDLISILTSREPLYAKADLILDTAGKTPERSLQELLALLDHSRQAAARRYA